MKILYKLFILILFFSFQLNSSIAQLPDSWIQKNNLSSSTRTNAVAFEVDGVGYIGTGMTNFTFLGDFWKYDIETDSWTQVANFGAGTRGAAVSFVIDKFAYVLTGASGGKHKDIWQYDPYLNIWTQKTDLPAFGRNYATAFSIGSYGYLAGGLDSVNNTFDDFWRYDPANDSWTQMGTTPQGPISSAMAFTIKGVGYLAGGYGLNPLNEVWAFDTLTNSWTQKADLGTATVSDAAAFMIYDHGFICAGYVNSEPSNDLIEYDPLTDVWTSRAPIPGTAKTNPVAFTSAGLGFVGTGLNIGFAGTHDMYQYTPVDTPIATFIDDGSADFSISITPNPVIDNGSISVSYKGNNTSLHLEMLSLEGKLMSSAIMEKQDGKTSAQLLFQRDELPAGVYLVVIKDDEKILGSRKIVFAY